MSLKVCNKSEDLIKVGHGEYIVYHQNPSGQITAPSRKTYDATYAVLSHLNFPSTDNRYDVIRNKIKTIDPSLEIAFVPRTYYELHFLKKCIKEDLKLKNFCLNEQSKPDPYAPKHTEDCWHLVYFEQEEDNQAEAVKMIAFKMNENLVKKIHTRLAPSQSVLSFQNISALSDQQIQFFTNFAQTFSLGVSQCQGQFLSKYFNEEPPVQKFSSGSMAINSTAEVETIKNAITLECHPIAEKSFLLYRGTDFPTDLPYSPDNIDQPYSFSFGSGLFAGARYRQGATAYVYIREANNSTDGYVMAVPAQELPHAPFVIPKKHPLCHLSSNYGTVFHPRTKIWKTTGPIWGGLKHGGGNKGADPFVCSLDRETLSDQVLNFKKNNVIFIKSSRYETMVVPPAFQPTICVYAQIPKHENLFIRGNEAGLTWNKGQPLTQIANDQWIYRVSKDFTNLTYKICVGDVQPLWEEGADHTLKPANNAIEAPHFPGLQAKSPQGQPTRLSIRYNAGLGNSLKIYGAGPGMSWQNGVDLKNVSEDLWVWDATGYFSPFEYKIVRNGQWESGPNHRAECGKMVEVFPRL